MQSKLGYFLSGPSPQQSQSPITGVLHAYITRDFTECPDTTPTMSNLSTNPLAIKQDLTQPSESFMELYQRNHISRDSDGSYVVRFPWKQNHPTLPTNLMVCERQTRALARRLGHNPELLQLYSTIMIEQEQRGFIEKVHPSNIQNNEVHYIPHHPVHKNSLTTPVRIVYNCSCRQSKHGVSLNDCLMVGDPPLNDLCGILIRFRFHQYALSTDIEKAFLHVKLDEQDRDFTRFLWLSNPSDPESTFITYRFKVVLFGSTSSPFMLSAALDYHLNLYSSTVSSDMKSNLYVDNIISGCQTEDTILHYYTTARAIMKEANFNLRSWATNSRRLQERALADHTLDSETTVNLLGLRWNTCTDTVTLVKKQIHSDNSPMTKRTILQAASRQFDPLGWLSPITIRAKLFLQELWERKVQWDEPLENDLQSSWKQIATDMEEAANVIITRRYSALSSNAPLFLHVFADASTKAYGAVAYLQGTTHVDLVMAKSHVSPLKSITLPRLELKAAVIAAHLAKFILTTLQPTLNEVEVRLWSDSQIVLHWIFSGKQLLVANRIQEINTLFPNTK